MTTELKRLAADVREEHRTSHSPMDRTLSKLLAAIDALPDDATRALAIGKAHVEDERDEARRAARELWAALNQLVNDDADVTMPDAARLLIASQAALARHAAYGVKLTTHAADCGVNYKRACDCDMDRQVGGRTGR